MADEGKPERHIDTWSKELDELQNALVNTNSSAIPLSNSPLPYFERGPDELLQVPDHANLPPWTQKDRKELAKNVPAELLCRHSNFERDDQKPA
ncbi:hypothetical protein BV898_09758 [Hypsibius exemplaris]|uniref:Uncharacterized protein n=1 Tax=Hypsibius exemplaris TaxID=2072580 RepID=A0A1W0WLX3_HYPEX|nr:hypothetical protein BV898_09758 [Hypsibius exemplaris]